MGKYDFTCQVVNAMEGKLDAEALFEKAVWTLVGELKKKGLTRTDCRKAILEMMEKELWNNLLAKEDCSKETAVQGGEDNGQSHTGGVGGNGEREVQ